MTFQQRGVSNPPSSHQMEGNSLESLVDQVAQAVRDQLVAQGVPLESRPSQLGPAIHQHTVPPSTAQSSQKLTSSSLASMIDHTLLKPDATPEQVKTVCEEARQHSFATVCVNSTYVGLAAELLKGSSTVPIAVVGFPLGAGSTTAKAFEASEAIKNGAQEIDMVINIGALKARELDLVFEDIREVVKASAQIPVKVILETASLTDEEKIIACALSKAAGAAFVKTSTGFGSGGATVEDIKLMRSVVGTDIGVKASGGVRTYDDALRMIAAGANRIGASSSVDIVNQKAPSSTQPSAQKKSYKSSLY